MGELVRPFWAPGGENWGKASEEEDSQHLRGTSLHPHYRVVKVVADQLCSLEFYPLPPTGPLARVKSTTVLEVRGFVSGWDLSYNPS